MTDQNAHDDLPLSREQRTARDLRSLEAATVNTVFHIQEQMALGKTDALTPTNTAFRRNPDSSAQDLPTVSDLVNAENVNGRTADEDAADPLVNFTESAVTIKFLSSEENAASMDAFMDEWEPEPETYNSTLRLVRDDDDARPTAVRASESWGGAQIQIDVDAQQFLKQQVQDMLPGHVFVDEESFDEDWERLVSLREGDGVVVCDPLDGSAPFGVTGQNWNVVALLCEERNGRIEVLGAAIASPDHTVCTVDLVNGTVVQKTFIPRTRMHPESGVAVTHTDTIVEVLDAERPIPDSDPRTITTVALTARHRKRVADFFKTVGYSYLPPVRKGGKVLDNEGYSVNPYGGNPGMVRMATRGGVRYFVQGDWSTPFDAAGMLLLAMQPKRYEYWRLDDLHRGPERIFEDDVVSLFHDIHRPNKDGARPYGPGSYRCIPPMFIRERDGGYGGDAVTPHPDGPPPIPGWTITDYILDRLMLMRRRSYDLVIEREGIQR